MPRFARVLLTHLRTGDWITAARVRSYSAIVLAVCVVAIAGWIAMSDRGIDRNGKPLGTDFSNPYAAGQLALAGRAADAYDPALLYQAEKQAFGGRDVPFYGWHYPPFFFAVAVIVASMPYLWGLLLWQAFGIAAFLAVIRSILPRPETLLAAMAFPAVFVNIGHGQNGFLTAALLGAALHLLDRRPALAGLMIGCLAYKPQFGVLIPLALVVSGRWTTLISAACTVIISVVLSMAVLGIDIWRAFARSTAFTQTVILEQGATGWEKIQSIFSAVRMWGGGVETAYAAQLTLALMLAATLIWLWRSAAAFELKAAALTTASLLATPYVLDYDLVALGVAIVFFAAHGFARGFRDYEISLLAAAWVVPLPARGLMAATGLPIGLMVLLLLYGMILRRAAADLGGVKINSRGLARV